MMAIDTEKVMDAYTENVWAFSKSLIALVAIGWLFEFVTDIESTAFKGAGIAFCMVMYIPYILYQMARSDADDKRYAVEEANEALLQAKAYTEEAFKQRGEAINVATSLKEQANAFREKANALADECERLRADDKRRLDEMRTLEGDNRTLESERQTLLDKIANAERLQANAVANAKKELQALYSPYVNAGKAYMFYAVGKGMANHNSPFDDTDKAKGKEAEQANKAVLDAFVSERKEDIMKLILEAKTQ